VHNSGNTGVFYRCTVIEAREKEGLFLGIGWCSLLQAVAYCKFSDAVPKGPNTLCQEQWIRLGQLYYSSFLMPLASNRIS